jgi:hypothetical protein
LAFFYHERNFIMPTLLPTDADNNTIQALRLKSGGAHTIAATSTSARNTNPFASDTKIVSLYVTAPVYVRFGASGVTAAATDHYFPEGIYYDFAISGGDKGPQATHVAVLAASANASVYISEKE